MNLKEDFYQKASSWWWNGRSEKDAPESYIHETISCIDVQYEEIPDLKKDSLGFGLVGYCCQEGVRRNNGRIGSAHGPRSIRNVLGPLANPLRAHDTIIDLGNFHCLNEEMETTQQLLGTQITNLLNADYKPVVLGGGHDVAFANYLGIRNYLDSKNQKSSLGIINIDAHFDLRTPVESTNSGTPFLQIAEDLKSRDQEFHYMCLGIQEASNSKVLFNTAKKYGTQFRYSSEVNFRHFDALKEQLTNFMDGVDNVYLTIDLDGIASAHAPGVSAPSPFGVDPDIVLEIIKIIKKSDKLISADIAELNPTFDRDNCTACLAARFIHELFTRTS